MKIVISKSHTVYRAELKPMSEYDFIEITQDIDGRILAKWLDTRWRTVEETQKLFRLMADELEFFNKNPLTSPNKL